MKASWGTAMNAPKPVENFPGILPGGHNVLERFFRNSGSQNEVFPDLLWKPRQPSWKTARDDGKTKRGLVDHAKSQLASPG